MMKSDGKKPSLALMVLGGKAKPMGPGMGMGPKDDEPDDDREGLESAADDVMTAIKQDDGHGFVDAMLAFIELAKRHKPGADSEDDEE